GEHLQLAGLAQTTNQLQVDIVPGGRGSAIHFKDLETFRQPGALGDTARLDRAGDRRHRGDANYGDHPESDDGKQEVGDGASGDDGDALLDALAVECLTELLLGYRRFALVEHLHVAAQRDAGYGEFGAVTV